MFLMNNNLKTFFLVVAQNALFYYVVYFVSNIEQAKKTYITLNLIFTNLTY